jgi:hypothetical protein
MLSQFPGQSQRRIADIANSHLSVPCAADNVIAVDAELAVENI